ncbi:MAG: acyl-CoA dehydrogenase family protein [Burkholderiales bacterium]|nr:acyl-CoA dehydrogenase family protein [Burkholderiales bacterium]
MSLFTLDENQTMLADSARRFIERAEDDGARAARDAHAHGCTPERWRAFADLGWLALPLAEADEGLGGSAADLCVLAEEFGRGNLLEPWVACAVLGAGVLAEAGTAAQRARWLPAAARGDRRIAFAAWEPGARFDPARVETRAVAAGSGFRLTGVKELVLGAPGADALVAAARLPGDEAPALFLVEAGAAGCRTTAHGLIDGSRAARVAFDGAPAERLDGAPDARAALWRALDRATLAHCAETIGAMARAFEVTLDYLKTRKQFGRVLAGNQVLQHRLVDCFVAVEEARALTRAAAQAFGADPAAAVRQVAAAKAFVADAARDAWQEAVQMHGAIGMTDEYVIGRYVKRLAAAQALYGDADFHLERVAAAGAAMRAAA